LGPIRTITLAEAARLAGGALFGPEDREVRGLASLEEPDPARIAYASSEAMTASVSADAFAALIVPPGSAFEGARIECARPVLGAAAILEVFRTEPWLEPGIDARAFVHPEAQVDAEAWVGPGAFVGPGASLAEGVRVHPGAYIGQDVRIGSRTWIMPNAVIHHGAALGEDCIIHAGAVIGAEGFRFEWDGSGHRRLWHSAGVRLGDGVEIGACSCVDRGLLEDTVIGAGSKIDNQVQIGHNSRLGCHVLIAGQAGMGGSVEIGDGVVIGGQAGIGDHLRIAPGVMLGGQTAVHSSLPTPGKFVGRPAMPYRQAMRALALQPRLPELARRVADLERRLEDLKNALDSPDDSQAG
jgi:UDP-3-O-[3-hydroxymyristoyl] glucosamine N-acyltransferase